MRERVIVPLDGSQLGEAALPYVRDLFSKLTPEVEREIVLLHVVDPVAPMVYGWSGAAGFQDVGAAERETEQNRQEALKYLEGVKEGLVDKGLTVTVQAPVGQVPDEIVRVAEEMDADLIAMSTHGRSGLTRWAFGSVTDRVLRSEGKIPVLTVRPVAGQ